MRATINFQESDQVKWFIGSVSKTHSIYKMLQEFSTIVHVLGELRRLRSHDRWNANQLLEYQEQSFAALRQFAYKNSPFYQKFHKGLEKASLKDLPVLTKSMIMDNFNDFVTDRTLRLEEVRAHVAAGSKGRFKNKYEVVATSGSTGTPAIFLFNEQEWTTVIASFARAREWAGLKLNLTRRSKMAVVSSTNERNVSARVGKTADTPFIPTLRLDATESIANIVAKLNHWKPEALVAYASMAYFLANEQEKGELDIHPRFIFTASEVLTSKMREVIENVWGKVVFDEYVSTETATIAAEDKLHHGMHVFEDLLIIENVDQDNNSVQLGTYGSKILVTTLFSRTQPLIRYEISDNIRFAVDKVSCGLSYARIDAVQGRQEDMLIMPGLKVAEVKVHPNVFHDVMDVIPNKGWQIIQAKNYLHVLLMDTKEKINHNEVKDRIVEALEKQDVKIPKIEVQKVEQIPKEKSGKSPLIKAYKAAH